MSMAHEWHVAINAYADLMRRNGSEWPRFMYEAKTANREVRRLTLLFGKERQGGLPKEHQQCSRSQPQPVADNHLSCCLGVECRKCPHLAALEVAKLTPEQIDEAKAWTCVAHILMSGGDVVNEGYVLTVDDRMFWDRVYDSLANTGDDEGGLTDQERE